jgi:hypothetical protein
MPVIDHRQLAPGRPGAARAALGGLALFALLMIGSCDAVKTASFVEPSFTDPCELAECGAGVCVANEQGAPECLCNPGYEGPSCSHCEPEFHRDALNRCVTDRLCSEQPANVCDVGGTCVQADGVITCECDVGYEGPRCTLCADRHARDETFRCLPLYIVEGEERGDAQAEEAAMSCAAGFSGPGCKNCSPGYHRVSESCVLDEVCRPTSCPPNGLCTVVGGVVECTCEVGYGGPGCSRCAAGSHREDEICVADQTCTPTSCSAQADCSVVKGRTVCTCKAGHQGTDCASCSAGYKKQGDACVVDTGACPPGQHAQDGGTCVADAWCEQNSCPEHATCMAAAGVVTCPCDSGWSPAGTCTLCTRNGTERSGFEFPTGWSAKPNQCNERSELSVSLITFRSRTGPNGAPDAAVRLCARSTFSQMSTQHIELATYKDRPATMVFEHPALLVAFDFGARIEPLALDVFAFDNPTNDMSVGGREVGKIDLAAQMRATFTIPLQPAARALALRSRTGKLQDMALDDLVYSYPECE